MLCYSSLRKLIHSQAQASVQGFGALVLLEVGELWAFSLLESLIYSLAVAE